MMASETELDQLRDEAIDWLLQVEATPQDPELLAALSAWRRRSAAHEAAYRSVQNMWQLASDLPVDYAQQVGNTPAANGPAGSAQVHALPSHPARHERRPVRSRRLAVAASATLAACLVLLVGSMLPPQWGADHTTGVGEISSIRLDDGSMVSLDTDSAITVNLDATKRQTSLITGRAFFDVARDADRPFVVAAEPLRITVTGTGFAVDSNPAGVSVTVQEGSVEVATDTKQTISLRPGDRLKLNHADGTTTRTRVPPTDIAAWRHGQLIADGMALQDVVAILDRYHRGVILLTDDTLADQRVTGVFNLREPLAALRAAVHVHGAEVMKVTPYLLWVGPAG